MKKENFIGDSEYLETFLVAVPKSVVLQNFPNVFLTTMLQEPSQGMESQIRTVSKYGCTSLINVGFVPVHSCESYAHKSLAYRLIDSDEEFSLFSVVVFRRSHDDFVLKCRDNKYEVLLYSLYAPLIIPRYIVREFVYTDDGQTQQREELDAADITEKELWVTLPVFSI